MIQARGLKYKLGDSNIKFSYACMKGRKSQNQIAILTKEDDTKIKDPDEFVSKVISFYQNLLGQSICHMPTANPLFLKDGPVFTRAQ